MSNNIITYIFILIYSYNNVKVDIFVLQQQQPHAMLKAVIHEQAWVSKLLLRKEKMSENCKIHLKHDI